MLSRGRIIEFRMEQNKQYYGITIFAEVEFFISQLELFTAEILNEPLDSILRSYNLSLEDILIENLIGLS